MLGFIIFIANRKVVFDLTAEKVDGDPDGMTIDSDGNLWVACFNSNHVSFLIIIRLFFYSNKIN